MGLVGACVLCGSGWAHIAHDTSAKAEPAHKGWDNAAGCCPAHVRRGKAPPRDSQGVEGVLVDTVLPGIFP